jgi:cytochrome c peroxidase
MSILRRIFVVALIAIAPGLLSANERAPSASELGRALFFDPSLSADGSIACASCHMPDKAFSDGRTVSRGVGGAAGTRNAPSLTATPRLSALFWDGRRATLEELALDPFTNPVEMALPSLDELVVRARRNHGVALSTASTTDEAVVLLRHALAAYVATLPRGASEFDRYWAAPARGFSTPGADKGYALFTGKANCVRCHVVDGTEPLLTDQRYHHSGVGWPAVEEKLPALVAELKAAALRGNELGDRIARDASWAALGRYATSGDARDLGAFRTPSLRNVAVTAPYMHDGSIADLRAAVDHEVYYLNLSNPKPIVLTQAEREQIVAFLTTLTEPDYLPRTAVADADHIQAD